MFFLDFTSIVIPLKKTDILVNHRGNYIFNFKVHQRTDIHNKKDCEVGECICHLNFINIFLVKIAKPF